MLIVICFPHRGTFQKLGSQSSTQCWLYSNHQCSLCSPHQGGQAHPAPLSHTEWICHIPIPPFVPGLAAMTVSDSRCHCHPPATAWGPPKSSLLRGLFAGAITVVQELCLLTSTRKSSRRLNLLRYSCSLLLISRFLALEYFKKAQNFSSP